MPNLLALSGATPQKQTRFSPIYTGRWSSGIWTNRSPLRDANTTRLSEKFYGPSGDALISGVNVEITNRLTLARRAGNINFGDGNTWNAIDNFYEFHLFGPAIEQIDIMVDQSDALYALLPNNSKKLIWTKSTGAGQTFMQSVGNSLYFGNGVDQKKWLQSLQVWSANYNWTQAITPLFSTFLIDPNDNIQQLTWQGVSGGSQPTWSTQIPTYLNNFTGGVTIDGTAEWTNHGPTVENWGIVAPTQTLTPSIGAGGVAWQSNTRYSGPGVVIDSNGNLQKVTTKGLSGAVHPTWATVVGNTTTDNTVVWTMIQTAASLVWTAHTPYTPGQYLIGSGSLFRCNNFSLPTISGNVLSYVWPGGNNGAFTLPVPTDPNSSSANATGNSINFQATSNGGALIWETLNGAGETVGTTTPFPSFGQNYQMVVTGTLHIPNAGSELEIKFTHHDGAVLGIGGGAVKLSGPPVDDPLDPTRSQSAVLELPLMGGTNKGQSGAEYFEFFAIRFPSAGDYPFEIDYARGTHNPAGAVILNANDQDPVPGTPISGATEPIWPSWTTSFAPSYPKIDEQSAKQMTWSNLGPITDFVWQAGITFTLPGTTIIDPNANTEAAYRTGTTGATAPTFAAGLNQLTPDSPNLIWINQGLVTAPPSGTLSTFNGGWKYAIALVNTVDDTVSNCGPLSAATGDFIGIPGIVFAPGQGLPTDLTKIDPQADYVAIFRTTDGQSVPFLIPGILGHGSPATFISTTYTIPLHTYLTNGYTDTTPDTGLNNLIEGAILGQNTPPQDGAINLTFHLNRIFFSIGNTVYWTAGPDTPVGNGVNGVPPLNFDVVPSLVTRIVPTGIGALVFTVADTYVITGSGTTSNPIQGAQPYLKNLGLSSYNALDIDGSIIGLFTTEKQFIILDPSAGTVIASFPIADQFQQNNGQPGTSWNPATAYVTCHVDGEEHSFYVGDGRFGWFRLMTTPAPETGYTWSPFAAIVGGLKALQSVEVTPGIHKLLLGPSGSGHILNRDYTVFSDDGVAYPANATIGSAVLAQPGQVATVMFLTTDSVRVGTPLTLGILLDEAFPYYTGPIEYLIDWVDDPVNLPPSKSIIGQRFYLDELKEKAAVCRHCQTQILWSPTDTVQNELLSLTIFGGYLQEE